MMLAALLPEADLPEPMRGLPVTGLAQDSRAVRPGDLFVAIPGTKADGLGFAAAAVAAGAVAVLAERRPEALPDHVPVVIVSDVRLALARAAATLHPAQPGTIVAVTGTSGKTSVADFTRQIWAATGHRAASVGTLGVIGPDGGAYGSLTTPDPVTLHATLDRLTQEGVSHLALEASSHGLDQRRLDAVRLAAGAFTNLSRDHLDYHASLEDYLAAKLRLFTELLTPGQPAVVVLDGAEPAPRVAAAAEARGLALLTVGREGRDLRLAEATLDASGTRLAIDHAGRRYDLRLPLAGDFQVANALVAAGLAIATGTPAAEALGALEGLQGAPGRLERVGIRRGAPIFVDYAHKPGALETVLKTLRPYAERRLVVVFGCGGDRDPGKRPMMGEIAARLADVAIVTDDNPRSEDPGAIRAAILAACPGALEIGDRALAIRTAVAALEPGDVLVVAGKGHETGQTVRGVTLPFSDAEAVAAALKDLA